MVEIIRQMVRPVMAICFIVMMAVGFFTGRVEWDSISQLVAAVVAFYFAERAALKKPENGA